VNFLSRLIMLVKELVSVVANCKPFLNSVNFWLLGSPCDYQYEVNYKTHKC
jgi:hypothetical protein